MRVFAARAHGTCVHSAAQPGAPTTRQRCIDIYGKAALRGSASACSSFAAPLAAPSASEPMHRSLLYDGARRVRTAAWLVPSTWYTVLQHSLCSTSCTACDVLHFAVCACLDHTCKGWGGLAIGDTNNEASLSSYSHHAHDTIIHLYN